METVVENQKEDVLNLVLSGIEKGMSYQAYRELVKNLAENRATTGPEQLESLINYTQLNDRRMARWDKTLKISEEIKETISNLDSNLAFLALSESWCGDASPSLPVINKIAELNEKIEFKIVLRDENLPLMDKFLTNGTRSIPKLIVWDTDKEEVVGEWGPRPSIAAQMVEDYKKEHGKLTADFKQDLQIWYNKDKGQNTLEDLVQLLTLK
ncbi:thioredoxin family protein [Flagellimonas meridianipacifica]|uniref:Thioredoxin-like protein n=1 Tax=Flagellimonas meridianipacifica TaxID=1080225 RepID=A0A2T0MG99_9FLAO|nr:thioredoxin family protein [Allomuricauda pacifica]PRX56556.1 thioredoxin-like protein [Allomuricauda pacifica]